MDPEQVLARWWAIARADPRVADLVALVPQDRRLTLLDAIPLAPLVMAHLETPEDQVALLAVVSQAYQAATRTEVAT